MDLTFRNFLALRESLMNGDGVAMLRAYWSGQLDAAPALADALDEGEMGLGDLVRIPLLLGTRDATQERRAKKVYNAAFRLYWPQIAAAAPVASVVLPVTTIQRPRVTFISGSGVTTLLNGKSFPYHRREIEFRVGDPGNFESKNHPPVLVTFRMDPPREWFAAHGDENAQEAILDQWGVPINPGVFPDEAEPEMVTIGYRTSHAELLYCRLPTAEDLTPAIMLRAIVTAGSDYGSADIQRMARMP